MFQIPAINNIMSELIHGTRVRFIYDGSNRLDQIVGLNEDNDPIVHVRVKYAPELTSYIIQGRDLPISVEAETIPNFFGGSFFYSFDPLQGVINRIFGNLQGFLTEENQVDTYGVDYILCPDRYNNNVVNLIIKDVVTNRIEYDGHGRILSLEYLGSNSFHNEGAFKVVKYFYEYAGNGALAREIGIDANGRYLLNVLYLSLPIPVSLTIEDEVLRVWTGANGRIVASLKLFGNQRPITITRFSDALDTPLECTQESDSVYFYMRRPDGIVSRTMRRRQRMILTNQVTAYHPDGRVCEVTNSPTAISDNCINIIHQITPGHSSFKAL